MSSYQNEFYSYKSKMPIYSLAFSTKKDNTLRLAIGSLNRNPDPQVTPMNYIEIIELKKNGSKLKRTSKFEQKIPPSKILFFPDHSSANPDLLITSSDTLKIWEILENGDVEIRSSLWNVRVCICFEFF
jgi:WD repeat-containing protein 68